MQYTRINHFFLLGMLLILAFVLSPDTAHASMSGGGLPYEDGLQKLKQSFTGPVPFVISLVAIVACVGMLIFGGDLSGFARTLIFIVLGVSTIAGASNIYTMFGGSGAEIARAPAFMLAA